MTDWPVPLDVALKGGRSYIRGADMLEAAVQAVPHLQPPVSLRCHHLTDKRLVVSRAAAGTRPDPSLPGMLIGKLDNENCVLEVLESDSGDPPPSVPYDEDEVVEAAQIDGATATMPYNQQFSLSDNLVALNKKLLKGQPGGNVTWLLTRLDLSVLPASPEGMLKITMAGPFSLRLVRSTLELGGQPIGAIFFSAAAQ